MIANWFGRDKFNKRGTRNLENTNRIGFNCGGYALGTFNWYQPFDESEGSELFGWLSDLDVEEVLERTVNYMLKDFKGRLRIIDSVKDLQDDEYAIAYRVGGGDFHYAKRSDKGVWYHKTGQAPIIKRMSKDEIFGEDWNDRYNSEVVLFAKKKVW